MIFIATAHFNRPQDDEMRSAHREWAHKKYREGSLLLSGVVFDGDRSGYVFIRANSREEADALMNSDPVVADGSVSISMVEFEPHVRLDNLVTALGDLVVLEESGAAS